MKRKVGMIIICFAILIGIFARNVYLKINEKNKDKEGSGQIIKEELLRDGEMMTRADAFYMFSYLFYNDQERSSLERVITYEDTKQEQWYDEFINAVHTASLIGNKEELTKIRPNDYISLSELIEVLYKYSELVQVDSNVIMMKLESIFNNIQKDSYILVSEFYNVYEYMLSLLPEEQRKVSYEAVYVLKVDEEKNKLVTDKGSYGVKKWEIFDHQDDVNSSGQVIDYESKKIRVLVNDWKIISISSILEEETTLENVYIILGEGTEVNTYINGVKKKFNAQYPLSSTIEALVGDITVQGDQILKVSIKPDSIQGKVLLASEDTIEIEGYGKLTLDPNFKIYKVYGELAMEDTNAILVGYSSTKFVVSGGIISAALLTEPMKAENIRVLLKTDEFKSIFHDTVTLTSDEDFTLQYGDEEKSFKANKKVEITLDSKYFVDDRLIFESNSESGKLRILSITRSDGNPAYRGRIEVVKIDNKLVIINELSLEEYLYAVIPSEMPTSYGLEALKVQAVCARSYAYNQLISNKYSNYGAHVDDSVSFQVYNNIAENETSIRAVKETYGKVIEYQGDIITAYYFSTSCGYTASIGDVWVNGEETSYLTGKLQSSKELLADDADQSILTTAGGELYLDLSDEDTFRSFLNENKYATYDSQYPWYRWNVTMKVEDLSSIINGNLKSRYEANPSLLKTLVTGEDGAKSYESKPIESIGTVKKIYAEQRKTGGLITELVVVGSQNTIKIITEYNIRALLSPKNQTITRNDGSTIESLSILPSAFFVMDLNYDTESSLQSVTFTGGGYGHGVGMSQNGVKTMVELGNSYEEVIDHYYTGTTLALIYEE